MSMHVDCWVEEILTREKERKVQYEHVAKGYIIWKGVGSCTPVSNVLVPCGLLNFKRNLFQFSVSVSHFLLF